MKTLLSLLGGAITITESSGVVSLNFDESLGGGKAAGLIKGQGSIVLDGNDALQISEGWLNGELPASLQPIAVAIEGVANAAVKAIE